ncbi:E3 ubiquitin-protein ligase [Operophtera brumata]|uniref:E3 ubiquitin-protein ligase n=1 Tax=Operophtera brumata TaxID=104452 RepID=A0A0L7L816_OPEBR|nr:E3 ubiquitin-protein ligase [Operophtera brumata]
MMVPPQSLLRLLECPVCLEWMEPPMSQCRRGHLVCCRCRARLASCPVCRTTFSSVRNRAMEGEQHTNMLKVGSRQRFGIKVNVETHETWLLLALDELFLLKVDVDVRTWGVVVDLESSSLNVSRQDCFHLTLDQNRHFDAEKYLEFDVELSKVDPPPSRDDSDS